ncbi:MAG: hypothetical protein ACFB6S_03145 [Geminicoccaceae bacterium]
MNRSLRRNAQDARPTETCPLEPPTPAACLARAQALILKARHQFDRDQPVDLGEAAKLVALLGQMARSAAPDGLERSALTSLLDDLSRLHQDMMAKRAALKARIQAVSASEQARRAYGGAGPAGLARPGGGR